MRPECLAPLVVLFTALTDARAEKLPRLLVMPLVADQSLESSSQALDEMILQSAHDIGRFEVMGQEDLNALMGVEALKDAMGCSDVSCAAELGGALGAPYLLAGKLTSLGSQVVLSLRLMDTQAPAVVARATARGERSGDSLIQMMGKAMGACFNVATDTDRAPDTKAATTNPAAPDYREYQKIMTALGKRMANARYTELLADLDRIEMRLDEISMPPTIDLAEYIVFYRVTACSTLKRIPCLQKAAATYQKRWPDGMYQSSIQTYLDRVEDAALAREDGRQALAARLAEIEAGRQRGTFDDAAALEMIAYAYYTAKQYDEAAKRFRKLLPRHAQDPEKQMQLVQTLTLALEQEGRFVDAREILNEAQRSHPRLFRRAGLHHTLRRLPR